jgi:hypothetical protein
MAAHRPRTARPRSLRSSRYFAIAFFESYESAAENSSVPETRAAAALHMQTSEDAPVFYNLDILEHRAQAAAFGTVAFVLPPIPYTMKRVRCLPRKTQKGD